MLHTSIKTITAIVQRIRALPLAVKVAGAAAVIVGTLLLLRYLGVFPFECDPNQYPYCCGPECVNR